MVASPQPTSQHTWGIQTNGWRLRSFHTIRLAKYGISMLILSGRAMPSVDRGRMSPRKAIPPSTLRELHPTIHRLITLVSRLHLSPPPHQELRGCTTCNLGIKLSAIRSVLRLSGEAGATSTGAETAD